VDRAAGAVVDRGQGGNPRSDLGRPPAIGRLGWPASGPAAGQRHPADLGRSSWHERRQVAPSGGLAGDRPWAASPGGAVVRAA
jgi:hypothetical protein